MPTKGRIREVEIAAADTRTNMTTLSSNSTPGSLKIPGGHTKAKQLAYSVGAETPTLADHGGVAFVRIYGDGIDGEAIIPLAGTINGGTTAGDVGAAGAAQIDAIDLSVIGGAEFQMTAEMAGVDANHTAICVCLYTE